MWRVVVGIFLILSITAGAVLYQAAGNIQGYSFLGGNPDWALIWRILFLALSMSAGIVFGTVYKILSENRDANGVSASALSRVAPNMLRSMLASPLVFLFVYVTAHDQPDAVIAGLLAFENGFFCDAILNKWPELKL